MRSWENTELTPNQRDALQGPSPCELCPHWQRCASEEVACGDYSHWQATGKLRDRDRDPTAEQYRKIFGHNQQVRG